MTSTTRNRFGNVGSISNMANSEPLRVAHPSTFGSGFGHGGNGWQGGIWGNTIGSGLKSGSVDSSRNQDAASSPGTNEAITGSGSLLPLSETDHWGSRHAGPWKSVDNTSPSVSSSHTNHSSTSPVRRQSSNQLISQPFAETSNSSSSYFSIHAAPMNQGISNKQARKTYLDSATGSFVTSNGFDPNQIGHASRHNSEEENRYSTKSLALSNGEMGFKAQSGRPQFQTNFSGYNSSAASRSGSLPPSRNGAEVPPRFSEEPVSVGYSHLGSSSSSHRQNLSAHSAHSTRTASYSGKIGSHPSPSPTQIGALSGEFTKMNLGKENHSPYYIQQKESTALNQGTSASEYSHQQSANDPSENWGLEEGSYHSNQDIFTIDGVPGAIISHPNQFRGTPFNVAYAQPPGNSDARRNQESFFYPSGENLSSGSQHQIPKGGSAFNLTPNGQAAVLDRKLRGLQQIQQEQAYPSHSNPMGYRTPFAPQYEFHQQNTMRMNPLAPFYQMPPVPTLLAQPAVLRGATREHDVSQNVRSPLLEEFRNNSKTNKRYEIKDIYNNIVEFSGDQHGSRFIQQKLETANSDEKDQVFREIHPNSLQLMTDVFGNYVIQKFFEHGNQAQKKILAGQMKNHILALSLQMYGCRVVQKALEHILTDQQAQLVKELEHHVLKCVKDQNGNHVVQKAIERVPAEHIQFIINAFAGQVHGLAIHPYGCRVIQRMLEHCEEPTRSAVLQELHACASTLIVDQYGNYVTQHVIEHGKEDDRSKVISLITGNLVNFSKHKFASNVVEKSIQFGTAEQRQKIVDTLTVLNDKGESPLQSLIRDQYGNYVIQKLLTQLKDSEFDKFVELIKPQLALLKRFSYGKQIAAIEKVVYNNPTALLQLSNNAPLPLSTESIVPTSPPSLLAGNAQSPQSSSLPSTQASSINGALDSRKSSASNAVDVMTPTST